jgi:ATP-dependent helicase IRC3
MATSTAAADADIVVATVKSLVSRDRLLKFAPDMFKLVLVDEAHHIVAPSYRTVLEHFGLNERSEDSPALVGVSATLSRLDGVKLGAAIDHIVYHKDYVSMIDEKWLANAVFTTVKSKANLSKVKSDKFGDLALTSLSKAVNTETTNDVTVRAWLAHARDRKSTLGFCVDVDHARDLTATFRNSGIDARYMTGRTPKQVRQEQLTAFKNQEFPVLFNCGLFTEGTDIPNVDCVLLARPTVSRNLLIQMIGRGLRLFPGKTNCHIIDMVASLAKVGVLSTPTLFGLHPDEALNNASLEDFQRRKDDNPSSLPDTLQPYHLPDDHVDVTITKYENIYELIKDVSLEKHIRSLSRFAWVRVGDHRYVLSGTKGWISLEKLPAADPYQKGMYEVRVVTKFGSATESPTYTRPRLIAQGPDLESAVRSADTYAAREFEQRYIRTDMPWRKAPATENQLRILNKSRFRKQELLPSEVTRGQATDLITRLKLGGSPWIDSMQKRMNNEAKLMELRKREEVRVGPVPS